MIFLCFINFFYIPFGYLTSPGTESAMIYIIIMVIFIVTFIAVKRYEYIFSIVITVETVILMHTEVYFEDFYYVYTDKAYRITDLSINFLVVMAVIIYTIYFAMSEVTKYSKSLYEAGITDGLTGLYNRRFFNDFIQMEYDRARRHNQIFTIVLLDLNNFKLVNDTYGHRKGDMVLQDIARIVVDNIRGYDIAARYGGDEFVIIFPDTDKEKAAELMNRLGKAFKDYVEDYKDIKLSVAYGIEDSQEKSIESIYKMADVMLYKRKQEMKESNIVM